MIGKYIAIDVGGTTIKSALISEDGTLEAKTKTSTYKEGLSVMENLKQVVRAQIGEGVLGIGVATAGIVDNEKGCICGALENIPELIGAEIKRELEAEFALPVHVENDVNSFALGELYLRGEIKNFYMVALGTGIGGALVLDGKVIHGANHACGEIGYLHNHTGKSFEQGSSSVVFGRKVEKDFHLTVEELFERAKAGDKRAEEAVDGWAREIAESLSDIVYVTDVGTILIGGGVSAQGEYFRNKIDNCLQSIVPDIFKAKTKVLFVTKSNDTALYGAVYEFIKLKEKRI